MYRENRDQERVRRKQKVLVTPYFEDDPTLLERSVDATLFDAPKDGVCLETASETAKGRKVNVSMDIESMNTIGAFKTTFVADAVVRWVKPIDESGHRLGLQFDNLPKVQRERWNSFMSRWRTRLL